MDEDFNKLESIFAFCVQAVRVAGRFDSLWMIVNGDSFLWRRAYRNINLRDTKSAGLLHAWQAERIDAAVQARPKKVSMGREKFVFVFR